MFSTQMIIQPSSLSEEDVKAHVKAQQQKTQHWYIHSHLEHQIELVRETILSCIDIIRDPIQRNILTEDKLEPKIPEQRSRPSTPIGKDISEPEHIHKKQEKKNFTITLVRQGLQITEIDAKVFFKSIGRWIPIQLKSGIKLDLDQLDCLIGYLTQSIGWLKDIECDCSEEEEENINELKLKFQQLKKVVEKCIMTFYEAPRDLLFPLNSNLWSLNEICETDLKRAPLDELMSMEIFYQNGLLSVSFVNFEKVKESPWGDYNPITNTSYVDDLREKVKDNLISINDIKQSDKKKTLTHFLGFSKFTHMDYLQRGMTYKKQVVIEVEETRVDCTDSNLMTVEIKLRSVLSMVQKICLNLETLE